jgi:hypothetical protein
MSRGRRIQTAKDSFALLKANAWIAALLVAIASVVSIFIVESNWTDPAKSIANNVLAAVLSVALVSLIADVYFKTRFAQGFAELVGLRDDVWGAGLQRLELRGRADWVWVLQDARRISLVLVDPQPWASENWRYLQGQAELRQVEIGIGFVAPGSSACGELEGRLGRAMAATIAEGEEFLRGRWLDRQQSGYLHPKSRIGTFELPYAPAYSAAVVHRVDGHRRAVVELGGSSSTPLGTDMVLLVMDDSMARPDQDLVVWLETQVIELLREDRRTWASGGRAELQDPAVDPPPPPPTGPPELNAEEPGSA